MAASFRMAACFRAETRVGPCAFRFERRAIVVLIDVGFICSLLFCCKSMMCVFSQRGSLPSDWKVDHQWCLKHVCWCNEFGLSEPTSASRRNYRILFLQPDEVPTISSAWGPATYLYLYQRYSTAQRGIFRRNSWHGLRGWIPYPARNVGRAF